MGGKLIEADQLKNVDQITDKSVNNKLHRSFKYYFIPISTPADGNCMWHMISRSLCGDVSLTCFLKNFTSITLLILKSQFFDIIYQNLKSNNIELSHNELIGKTNIKFDELVYSSKTKGQWGNEYHLLALSTFLSTKIYIFNFFDKNFSDEEFMNDFKEDNRNNNTGLHLKYTPIKNCAFTSSVKQCVIYGHYNSGDNNQHYLSLILREKNDIFEPKTNLFQEFCI